MSWNGTQPRGCNTKAFPDDTLTHKSVNFKGRNLPIGMEYINNRSTLLWLLESYIKRLSLTKQRHIKLPLSPPANGEEQWWRCSQGPGLSPSVTRWLRREAAGPARSPARRSWGKHSRCSIMFSNWNPLSLIPGNYYGLYFCSVPRLLCETTSYRQVTAAVFDSPLQEILYLNPNKTFAPFWNRRCNCRTKVSTEQPWEESRLLYFSSRH